MFRDDDHSTFTQLSRSPVSHDTVDARLSGKGGLGGWSQSLGGFVRCVL